VRAIITTLPFGEIDPKPIAILREAGIEFAFNPLGRRLKPEEVASVIDGYDIVIAGTETIGRKALCSPRLKAICRVGIGLDGLDLLEVRRRGIAVSYTPEGPSPAVAELALGQIISLLRDVGWADRGLRAGHWHRRFGVRLSLATVGIVGCGRIGSRLIAHLLGGFPGVRVLAHDIRGGLVFDGSDKVGWVDLGTLLRESDVVSLHVPLTPYTRHMIGTNELAAMKPSAVLINTARGGVVDEAALCAALGHGQIAGAAIDVFEEEPYTGPLTKCENALLTCHMGSMTRDCRVRMEVEATQEAVRFVTGLAFASPIPEAEYELAHRAESARVS
jgi:D-3-phosphoglycerate dehydrogenase / 2-oxoglutarate reductase